MLLEQRRNCACGVTMETPEGWGLCFAVRQAAALREIRRVGHRAHLGQ